MMRKSKYYLFSFFLLAWIIFCFSIRKNIYTVQSNSMEYLLFKGDVLFVSKSHKMKISPKRNDIYLFSTNRKNLPSVKRIIGKPNDTICLWKDNIYINGNIYLNPCTVNHDISSTNLTDYNFKYINDSTFLYNTYFMVGDNRHFSIDSRHYGPIREEDILGKVIFVLFNYHNGKFRWDRFLKEIN